MLMSRIKLIRLLQNSLYLMSCKCSMSSLSSNCKCFMYSGVLCLCLLGVLCSPLFYFISCIFGNSFLFGSASCSFDYLWGLFLELYFPFPFISMKNCFLLKKKTRFNTLECIFHLKHPPCCVCISVLGF